MEIEQGLWYSLETQSHRTITFATQPSVALAHIYCWVEMSDKNKAKACL